MGSLFGRELFDTGTGDEFRPANDGFGVTWDQARAVRRFFMPGEKSQTALALFNADPNLPKSGDVHPDTVEGNRLYAVGVRTTGKSGVDDTLGIFGWEIEVEYADFVPYNFSALDLSQFQMSFSESVVDVPVISEFPYHDPIAGDNFTRQEYSTIPLIIAYTRAQITVNVAGWSVSDIDGIASRQNQLHQLTPDRLWLFKGGTVDDVSLNVTRVTYFWESERGNDAIPRDYAVGADVSDPASGSLDETGSMPEPGRGPAGIITPGLRPPFYRYELVPDANRVLYDPPTGPSLYAQRIVAVPQYDEVPLGMVGLPGEPFG